jgi:hypothetical protein
MTGDWQLLDVETGRELVRVAASAAGHRPLSLQFTSDGGRLVGIDEGDRKELRVWDLRRLRAGLAEQGLDWEADPLAAPVARPALRVSLDPNGS